eukprot:1692663-Rhodomonas_salina.3
MCIRDRLYRARPQYTTPRTAVPIPSAVHLVPPCPCPVQRTPYQRAHTQYTTPRTTMPILSTTPPVPPYPNTA